VPSAALSSSVSRALGAAAIVLPGAPRIAIRPLDVCDLAIVLTWQKPSIAAKARAMTTRLSEANDYLPDGIPRIVHIGFERLIPTPSRWSKIKRSVRVLGSIGAARTYNTYTVITSHPRVRLISLFDRQLPPHSRRTP
jgi:hypothetical protein